MVYILGGGAELDEAALLAAMFRARKEVFVDLLGWDVPVLDGRFEVDQFDGPDTAYLLVAGLDGSHWGSMRLLPTHTPNILGTIFPFLCCDAPPSSPDIWEISRLCLSRQLRATQRRIVRDQLVTAAVLFALQNNIRAFCCVADVGWMSTILSFGWNCVPLGLPQQLTCGTTGVLQINIADDTPTLLAAAGTWNEAPIRFADQALAPTS